MNIKNQWNESVFKYITSRSISDAHGNLTLVNLIHGICPLSTKQWRPQLFRSIVYYEKETDKKDFDVIHNTGKAPHTSASVKKRYMLFFRDQDDYELAGLTFEQLQMYVIAKAVVKCNGHCTQAARNLGLCTEMVYKQLRKYRRHFGLNSAQDRSSAFMICSDMIKKYNTNRSAIFYIGVAVSLDLQSTMTVQSSCSPSNMIFADKR